MPLLLTYAIRTREEACGLECQDFVFDVATPFLAVEANMTKSKDGKKPAGLKRASRYRMVPLHSELLRLGIHEYVAALEAPGHRMIFPELYQDGQIKRGGVRFYAIAGRYLLDFVDSTLGLLRTSGGKRADLRGAAAAQVQQGLVRQGRGGILVKRLKVMSKAIPNVTRHLLPQPVQLLPVAKRSRTGSAFGYASRK